MAGQGKLFIVSIMAMLVVMPASAEITSRAWVEAQLEDKVPTTTTVNGSALSSDVTLTGANVAVTGYTKPNSTGAIAATDTVNQAIGKLEKALDGKQASGNYVPTTTTVNGNALSSDVTLTAADVGAVPTSRTVNGEALSTDVTLDGADIALSGYTKPNSTSAVVAADTVNAAIGKLEAALDGKQASGNYVPTTTTVNGNALSSNVTLTGANVAVTGYTKPASTGAVAATDTVNAAIGKLEKGLDGKQNASSADYQMGNASGGWTTMTTKQQNMLNGLIPSGSETSTTGASIWVE